MGSFTRIAAQIRRPAPATPLVTHETAGGWRGRIVTRALPADLPAAEYQRILAGGTRRHQTPDGYSRAGIPIYRLTPRALAAVERDLDRLALGCQVTRNIACNAGRTVLLNFIGDTGSLAGVQYFAVGTGSPPAGRSGPAAGDTQLWTEYYRQAPTSYTLSGNQMLISTLFAAGVGNTTYTEAGIFGNGATGTANSGTLFAHATYNYNKTPSETLSNLYYIALT